MQAPGREDKGQKLEARGQRTSNVWKVIMRKKQLFASILFIFIIAYPLPGSERQAPGFSTCVLCVTNDPYHSLALEIAEKLNTNVVTSSNTLFLEKPEMVIFVASPEVLTEKHLIELGLYFKTADYFPALGIITGSTIDKAHALWNRGEQVTQSPCYLASDIDQQGRINPGVILRIDREPVEKISLTRANLIRILEKAGSLYWARHVSKRRWFWHTGQGSEQDRSLFPEQLPEMGPVVIHTPSCGSLYPWELDGIALGFIEKGAAAYTGHLYSPISSGFFIGHMHYFPPQYTWDGFPLGILVQVQNRSTARSVAAISSFFTLGDPRIHLTNSRPYSILEDHLLPGKRIITGHSKIRGVLPVRIEDGADYSFISIPGVSSVSYSDLFYNANIQPLKLGDVLYLLFLHNGGNFRIELRKKAPVFFSPADPVSDALDFSWIVIGVVNNAFALVFVFIFGLIFILKYRKKRKLIPFLPSLIPAAMWAVFYLLYIILRVKVVTVSSYTMYLSPDQLIFGFLGSFASTAAGCMVISDARSWFGRILGGILTVLPQALLTLFYTGFIIFYNILFYFNHPEKISIWNGSIALMPCIALVVNLILVTVFLIINRRMFRKICFCGTGES